MKVIEVSPESAFVATPGLYMALHTGDAGKSGILFHIPGRVPFAMECTNEEVAADIFRKIKDFLVTDLGTFHWHTVKMHIGAWEKASSGIGEKIAQYQRKWTSDFETCGKLVDEMDLHEYTDYESHWTLTPEGGIIHHYWKIQNNLVTA